MFANINELWFLFPQDMCEVLMGINDVVQNLIPKALTDKSARHSLDIAPTAMVG